MKKSNQYKKTNKVKHNPKNNKDDCIIKAIIPQIELIPALYKSFDFSNFRQQFSLTDYLTEILYVLKTGICWRHLRSKINWNSVYKVYCKLVKFKIFDSSYKSVIDRYLSKPNSKQFKLSTILTDTTLVQNKNGKDMIDYSYTNKKKKYTKISIITDRYGKPLNVECYSGNKYDSKILEDQISKMDKTSPIRNNHKKKAIRHLLADAGYDSNLLKEKIRKLGYIPLIAKNKRNTKKKEIIKRTVKEKEIFKRRIKVEHTIKRLKDQKRVMIRYDSKIENYKGFVILAALMLLC